MKLPPEYTNPRPSILSKLREEFHMQEDNSPSPESDNALACFYAQVQEDHPIPADDMLEEIEIELPHLAQTAREIAAQAGRLGL